ncbi:uncharacterized protein LOC119672995 [Teleopsis dalmanni]|uniref:uncharacterized protein LOC119672995 n=1 Tax=Teleopsis dalmanni TaxID=139649 RepID=UPI0018CD11C1|nr:uncharacterized protein LOC119672995 [Teleopsis dalmanni]
MNAQVIDELKNMEEHLKKQNQLELAIRNAILTLHTEFQTHYDLLQNEREVQKELLKRMTILMERFRIIREKPIKESNIEAIIAEEGILNEFHEKVQKIRSSNVKLKEPYMNIKCSFEKFQDLCEQLDLTLDSPFIKGNHITKPLGHFIEIINDFDTHFYQQILNLELYSDYLQPHPEQLNRYKLHLEDSEDFQEFFNISMVDFKYLQQRSKNVS